MRTSASRQRSLVWPTAATGTIQQQPGGQLLTAPFGITQEARRGRKETDSLPTLYTVSQQEPGRSDVPEQCCSRLHLQREVPRKHHAEGRVRLCFPPCTQLARGGDIPGSCSRWHHEEVPRKHHEEVRVRLCFPTYTARINLQDEQMLARSGTSALQMLSGNTMAGEPCTGLLTLALPRSTTRRCESDFASRPVRCQ
jgi:hypothetical protein